MVLAGVVAESATHGQRDSTAGGTQHLAVNLIEGSYVMAVHVVLNNSLPQAEPLEVPLLITCTAAEL